MWGAHQDDTEKLLELLHSNLIQRSEYDRRMSLLNNPFFSMSPPEGFLQDGPRLGGPGFGSILSFGPRQPRVPVRTGAIHIPVRDLNSASIPVGSASLRQLSSSTPPSDDDGSDEDSMDTSDTEPTIDQDMRQRRLRQEFEAQEASRIEAQRRKEEAERRAQAEAQEAARREAQRRKEEAGRRAQAEAQEAARREAQRRKEEAEALKRSASSIESSTDSAYQLDSSAPDSPATPMVKGLSNPVGANNCFLNVVIQSLWHMSKFRKAFLATEKHQHKDPCVFCALKQLFSNYQFGEESILPPGLLRQSLSALYSAEKRFQIGELDDAAEAHDAVLQSIHNSITGGTKEKEVICEPPCVVHSSFALSTVETTECSCQEVSDPLTFQEFIHYIPVESLASIKSQSPYLSMDKCIAKFHAADVRKCSYEGCKKLAPNIRTLLNCPLYVSIGLIWTKGTVERQELQSVLNAIDMEINLANMYNRAERANYKLRGFICYYGMHYVAYFLVKQPQGLRWVVFDDSSVFLVGSSWEDVVEKILINKHQPFVLWYEKSS